MIASSRLVDCAWIWALTKYSTRKRFPTTASCENLTRGTQPYIRERCHVVACGLQCCSHLALVMVGQYFNQLFQLSDHCDNRRPLEKAKTEENNAGIERIPCH